MARARRPVTEKSDLSPNPLPPLVSYESWLGIGQQPHPGTRPITAKGKSASPGTPPLLDPEVTKRFFGPYMRLFILPFWNFFLSDGIEKGWLLPRHLKVMMVLITLMDRENQVRQPQNSIARWAKIPPGALSKVLKELEQRGFIIRFSSRKGGFRLMVHPGLATCAHSSQIPVLTKKYETEIKVSMGMRKPEVGAEGHPRNYSDKGRAGWAWNIRNRVIYNQNLLVKKQRKAFRGPIQRSAGQESVEP